MPPVRLPLATSLCASHEFTDDEEALETLCECDAAYLVPAAFHALSTGQPETGRSVFRALFPVQRAGDLNRAKQWQATLAHGRHTGRLADAGTCHSLARCRQGQMGTGNPARRL